MCISVWLWRSDDTELHNAIGIYKEQIESPDPDNSKSEQRWIKQLTWHIHYVFASLRNPGIWNPTAKVSWLHEHHSVLHQSCSVMPGLTNFVVFRLLRSKPLQKPFLSNQSFLLIKEPALPSFLVGFLSFETIFELLTLLQYSGHSLIYLNDSWRFWPSSMIPSSICHIPAVLDKLWGLPVNVWTCIYLNASSLFHHMPITSLFTVLSQTAESTCFAQVVQCCRKLCGGIQNLANNACVDACESNVLWSAWFSGDKESKVKEYLPQIRPVLTCLRLA